MGGAAAVVCGLWGDGDRGERGVALALRRWAPRLAGVLFGGR